MHSLVYRSVANESFDLAQIYGMLSLARDFNAEHGITGCLLYHNSQFLQLLEGKEEEIMELYQKIAVDKRHHNVRLIDFEELDKRLFDNWSMAFHDYGQNGLSANIKLRQIDNFLNQSEVFSKKSKTAVKFFSNVRDILFGN